MSLRLSLDTVGVGNNNTGDTEFVKDNDRY